MFGKALAGNKEEVPVAEGPRDTEHGKAMFEIAKAELDRYRTTGAKVVDNYVNRQTGRFDDDGMAKINVSSPRSANESAFTIAPGNADPNRLGSLVKVGIEGAESGSEIEGDSIEIQQSRAQAGISNAAGIGVGRMPGTLASHAELASLDQAGSNRDAQETADRRAQRRYVNGQVIGGLAGIPISNLGKKKGGLPDPERTLNNEGPF